MLKRNQIEDKYKWDLSNYCKDEKDFYDRLKKLDTEKDKIKIYEGKLKDENQIYECLELEGNLSVEFGLLYVYANLKLKEDGADDVANKMCESISKVGTNFGIISTFIDIEIAKLSIKELKRLSCLEKFKNYKRFFEDVIKSKKHMLSKKEELLISGLGEFLGGFSDNFDKFCDVDLRFDDVKDSEEKSYTLNYSTYLQLAESEDRVLRKNTFVGMNGTFGKFINFIANNYISDVKADCYFAKLRKFKSKLDASIYNEEASVTVYRKLIEQVRENINLNYRYFEIKRRMLKLDKLAVYDIFAPITTDITKKYTYEEAIDLIIEACKPLGEEYCDLLKKARDERWIDVYPNENKDTGAFSWGSYGGNPVVLTNFVGNLESVFTLAHELGHALHSYYSNTNQPRQTAGYVIFLAEVASTVNEMLLLRYLLNKSTSNNEKMYYYDYFLKQVRSTIFRQTMFSEFEEKIHSAYENDIPLTKDFLCDTYSDLNNFYHGEAVEMIDEMKYEWARIPHFYNSFYVYKYSTGFICAVNFSKGLFENVDGVKDKYIKFLSSGSMDTPINILKIAGCDLENDETFNNVFEYVNEVLNDWESLLN